MTDHSPFSRSNNININFTGLTLRLNGMPDITTGPSLRIQPNCNYASESVLRQNLSIDDITVSHSNLRYFRVHVEKYAILVRKRFRQQFLPLLQFSLLIGILCSIIDNILSECCYFSQFLSSGLTCPNYKIPTTPAELNNLGAGSSYTPSLRRRSPLRVEGSHMCHLS